MGDDGGLSERAAEARRRPLSPHLGLLRLHLEAPADRVKGVRRVAGRDGGRLRAEERRRRAERRVVRLGPRVVVHQRVEEAKVHAAVRDDARDGHAEAVVQAEGALGASRRLNEAVNKALELLLARADVGRQARTRVVQGVDDGQRAGAGEATRRHVNREGLEELLLLVNLGEQRLDRVLEREVKGPEQRG